MAEKPAVGDEAPGFTAAVAGGDYEAGDQVSLHYGVWVEKNRYGKKAMGTGRTTFVIGKDGKIKAVFPEVKPDAHVDVLPGVPG